MTATDSLVEFLTARLDEDEAGARAATPGPWQWSPERSGWGDAGPDLETVARGERYSDGSQGAEATVVGAWGHDAWGVVVADADAEHITRHDPARVLADVAGKRRIIVAHPLVPARDVWGEETGGLSCETCDAKADLMLGGIEQPRTDGCVTLRALTAPYAGHPDYDKRWTL